MTCTRTPVEDNPAWKSCAIHGVFPVWLRKCPESPIPSTGDETLDMVIDKLLRPGTTEGERDRMRTTFAAGVMRGKPNRLIPLEA